MTVQVTQMDLGNGVRLEVESWDQLPVEVRQEVRKLAMAMIARLALYNVTLIRIGPAKNMDAEK